MKYEIIKESIEYDGYLQLLKAEIEHDTFDSEEKLKVTREASHRGDGCAILLFELETQQFIFTNQFRYPTTKSGNGWITEIVAGNIEPNESAEKSIKREVEEEVGYTIKNIESLGSFYVSPGRSTERIFLFFSTVSLNDKTKPGGGASDEDESIQTLKYSIVEVKSMIKNHSFIDAKTIIALQNYFLLQ